MLTDMYQITMVYAYWCEGIEHTHSEFNLYFRKNPFKGEFTIWAGVDEVLRFLQTWHFTPADVEYLRTIMPSAKPEFFDWLQALDTSEVAVLGPPEGTVVFPNTPLLRVVGPLGVCQLLETTLLNLTNFASLLTTNAARFRLAAGPAAVLLEFGARRAQGSDGAMSASKYACLGGFDGTSNVAAGAAFGVVPRGTHAHSFVAAYTGLHELRSRELDGVDIVEAALRYRDELGYLAAKDNELAAFIAYARSFPDGFLALVDTYDTLASGVPNFICVALALLRDCGRKPVGLRLDSGDLAYLSKESRAMLVAADEKYGTTLAKDVMIVASNDINEPVLHSLAAEKHEIDCFGIGTNLVTCQAQPALGMVYKLVQLRDQARIKISQEATKTTIPGGKHAYRLFSASGTPILDVLLQPHEPAPTPGQELLCRHPFVEQKRARVVPAAVQRLHYVLWLGRRAPVPEGYEDVAPAIEAGSERKTNLRYPVEELDVAKQRAKDGIAELRSDHKRALNPTPYKVSLSASLYKFLHEMMQREIPIPVLQ